MKKTCHYCVVHKIPQYMSFTQTLEYTHCLIKAHEVTPDVCAKCPNNGNMSERVTQEMAAQEMLNR